MRRFTHNHRDDTCLYLEDGKIHMSFTGEPVDDPDYEEVYEFPYDQDTLFEMLGDYFDEGKYQDIFDDLTLPAQDALWNALLWCNENNVEV